MFLGVSAPKISIALQSRRPVFLAHPVLFNDNNKAVRDLLQRFELALSYSGVKSLVVHRV